MTSTQTRFLATAVMTLVCLGGVTRSGHSQSVGLSGPQMGPGGTSPFSFVAADLDKDGDTDLAVLNHADGTVLVLINGGNGCFATAVNYHVGNHPRAIAAADLDRDGDLDLVVTNDYSSYVTVLRSNGNGSFAAAENYQVERDPWSVFATDLDGDVNKDGVTDMLDVVYSMATQFRASSNPGNPFGP